MALFIFNTRRFFIENSRLKNIIFFLNIHIYVYIHRFITRYLDIIFNNSSEM